MRGLRPECPRCGNVVCFRDGPSQGFRCKEPDCAVGVVTTCFPPIEQDPAEYALYLHPLGAEWKEKAARLATRFNLSLRDASQLRGPEEFLLFRGKAPDVFRVRGEVQALGCSVRIEPRFPYEVYDTAADGESPATEEILAWIESWMRKEGGS